MTLPKHRYDSTAARHYSAYRPPLHTTIVTEALAGQQFQCGADIGCGTGWSTIALKRSVRDAIGYDCSNSMIAVAREAEGIEYCIGEATHLPVVNRTFDLVSLAGVLPYLGKSALVPELLRICKPGATILIYDFLVVMEPLEQCFDTNFASYSAMKDNYDHSTNLSDDASFDKISRVSKRVSFTVDPSAASHLLLSGKHRLECLSSYFDLADPIPAVQAVLQEVGPHFFLEADVWWATYSVRPKSYNA